MCSNRENPEPKQLSCSPPDGKYPSEKSSQPAYKAIKPDSRRIGFHVASKRSQPELHKPGRAEGPARNGEVGGSGGNGWRQLAAPGRGGRPSPAVAVVVAVVVAVAAYILHLWQSTPKTGDIGQYSTCDGDIV